MQVGSESVALSPVPSLHAAIALGLIGGAERDDDLRTLFPSNFLPLTVVPFEHWIVVGTKTIHHSHFADEPF